jgi:hypothetical protein
LIFLLFLFCLHYLQVELYFYVLCIQSGAFAVSRFEFKEESTNWVQFLETTSKMLLDAKSSAVGSTDNLQLLFVISDGRVQVCCIIPVIFLIILNRYYSKIESA